MTYRNLPQTNDDLRSFGYDELAVKLLAETSQPILIERSYLVEFSDIRLAKRLRRLLNELFYYYENNRKRIKFAVEGTNLRIRLR